MRLISNQYGKGRVRIARVHRGNARDEFRDLSVRTVLEGEFAQSYTEGDNHQVVATDTIKNLTNIVAHENLDACAEFYAAALARRLLDRYSHVARVTVTCDETKWVRAVVGGQPHPHSFVLDSNGKPLAEVVATRDGAATVSGITGFTFMKCTEAGWVGFVQDQVTTLPETTDRIVATALDARWTWRSAPADYTAANARVLAAMLEEFATTYSRGVQDSLFRMAGKALDAVPELGTISMACPNKHYLPLNLSRFGIEPDNTVFTPTDEPHGQIECSVGRD